MANEKITKSNDERKLLKQIGGIIERALDQRLPAFDSLVSVRNKFAELAVAAKSIQQRDPAVGEGLPPDFVAGLDAAIKAARSFRSGYASNDASQQIADLDTIPGFLGANMVKSGGAILLVGGKDEKRTQKSESGRRVSVTEFGQYVGKVFAKLNKYELPEQLSILRVLQSVTRKANEEDFSDVLIPTDNDPMMHRADVEDSTIYPAGTSSPSTAADNFTADPSALTAPPPSKDPNPSTGTVVAGVDRDSSNPAGAASNFATTVSPAAANTGPAAGTSGVDGSQRGAGDTVGTDTNFASTTVEATGTQALVASTTKAASAPVDVEELAKSLAKAMSKDDEYEEVAWGGDLARRPEFGKK